MHVSKRLDEDDADEKYETKQHEAANAVGLWGDEVPHRCTLVRRGGAHQRGPRAMTPLAVLLFPAVTMPSVAVPSLSDRVIAGFWKQQPLPLTVDEATTAQGGLQ